MCKAFSLPSIIVVFLIKMEKYGTYFSAAFMRLMWKSTLKHFKKIQEKLSFVGYFDVQNFKSNKYFKILVNVA